MNINSISSAKAENIIEVSPVLSAVEKNNAVPVEKMEQKSNNGLSADNARELTEEMNDLLSDLQTSLGFSLHEKLNNQIVIEIKDRQTHELIKQIPTEELLAIKERMEEFRGVLLDQSI